MFRQDTIRQVEEEATCEINITSIDIDGKKNINEMPLILMAKRNINHMPLILMTKRNTKTNVININGSRNKPKQAHTHTKGNNVTVFASRDRLRQVQRTCVMEGNGLVQNGSTVLGGLGTCCYHRHRLTLS